MIRCGMQTMYPFAASSSLRTAPLTSVMKQSRGQRNGATESQARWSGGWVRATELRGYVQKRTERARWQWGQINVSRQRPIGERAGSGGRSTSAGSGRLASALAMEADRRPHFVVACDRWRRRGGGGRSRCLDLNTTKASCGSDASVRSDGDNGALESLGAVRVTLDVDHGAAQSL
jgi:hypothetical protein